MDAKTDEVFQEARKWLLNSRASKPPESERIIAGMIMAVSRLDSENERLWKVVSEMKAAAETAGLVFRNTDSGPSLVRY